MTKILRFLKKSFKTSSADLRTESRMNGNSLLLGELHYVPNAGHSPANVTTINLGEQSRKLSSCISEDTAPLPSDCASLSKYYCDAKISGALNAEIMTQNDLVLDHGNMCLLRIDRNFDVTYSVTDSGEV